jgi:hypothetical protein
MVAQDNKTLYALEMMYKNRDPPQLWNVLTDDLMYKILNMVDPQFSLPSIQIKTYADEVKKLDLDIPNTGKIETTKIIKKSTISIEQIYKARDQLNVIPEVSDLVRSQLQTKTPEKPPEVNFTEQLLRKLEEDRKREIVPTCDTYEDVVSKDIESWFCRSLRNCDGDSDSEEDI